MTSVDEFEVQINQLLNAAKAAASAADQARAVDPGAALEGIASALPGGTAASIAPTLAATFSERAKVWADEIDRWGESVTSTAKLYVESDDAARSAFD
jgi:hypothetical protein